jgi:hypothetical protein
MLVGGRSRPHSPRQAGSGRGRRPGRLATLACQHTKGALPLPHIAGSAAGALPWARVHSAEGVAHRVCVGGRATPRSQAGQQRCTDSRGMAGKSNRTGTRAGLATEHEKRNTADGANNVTSCWYTQTHWVAGLAACWGAVQLPAGVAIQLARAGSGRVAGGAGGGSMRAPGRCRCRRAPRSRARRRRPAAAAAR